MTLRTRLLVFASVGIIASSCSPTTPSSPTTGMQLMSLKYVRTRAVVAPVVEARVMMYSRMPHINDPLGRSQLGGVPLRAVDADNFVYDFPSEFYVPLDAECEFWVVDTAVSGYDIATDIYVNDTRIRAAQAGNYEHGYFKVDRRGRVY